MTLLLADFGVVVERKTGKIKNPYNWLQLLVTIFTSVFCSVTCLGRGFSLV
jgi:hypothetical protein